MSTNVDDWARSQVENAPPVTPETEARIASLLGVLNGPQGFSSAATSRSISTEVGRS